MQWNIIRRPAMALSACLFVVALILSGGCREYKVISTVPVSTAGKSPAYDLTIKNDLDTPLVVYSAESESGDPKITLPPGMTSDRLTIEVNKRNIGGSLVPQIVEGPYIGSESGMGQIQLRRTVDPNCPLCKSCSLRIDVEHESWFDAPPPSVSGNPRLVVCISRCLDGRKVFLKGPASDECAG